MLTPISQRELRNDSDEIMRRVETGEAFVVTRDGVPVGKLVPIRPHHFVRTAIASAVFAGADPVGADRFRRDVDLHVDQDPAPRR